MPRIVYLELKGIDIIIDCNFINLIILEIINHGW